MTLAEYAAYLTQVARTHGHYSLDVRPYITLDHQRERAGMHEVNVSAHEQMPATATHA